MEYHAQLPEIAPYDSPWRAISRRAERITRLKESVAVVDAESNQRLREWTWTDKPEHYRFSLRRQDVGEMIPADQVYCLQVESLTESGHYATVRMPDGSTVQHVERPSALYYFSREAMLSATGELVERYDTFAEPATATGPRRWAEIDAALQVGLGEAETL